MPYKLYGNADDSTLIAAVPSQLGTVAVPESWNRDLSGVNEWCD